MRTPLGETKIPEPIMLPTIRLIPFIKDISFFSCNVFWFPSCISQLSLGSVLSDLLTGLYSASELCDFVQSVRSPIVERL